MTGDPIQTHDRDCRVFGCECPCPCHDERTRPSGDEALRAAAKDIVTSFARRPGWSLEHDSEEADALRAALATPSSAPDVEGLIDEPHNHNFLTLEGFGNGDSPDCVPCIARRLRREQERLDAALRDSRS